MMINIHFSDNTTLKLDVEKCKTFLDIKKEIYYNKFKLPLVNSSDINLITYGKVVNDSDEKDIINNQVVLAKVNVNVEVIKFLNDERLLTLVSNEKTRKLLYEILENPEILERNKKYRFQKELDEIKNLKINVGDEEIKKLLDKHSGNIEIVVNSLFNF